MEILTIIFSVVSLIISVFSGIMGVMAFIELRSFMKSTHKVEFVPLDTTQKEFKEPKLNDELEKYGIV